MKIKVGVIYGGKTVEHEVSVISAVQAMNNLNKDKYEIIPIYISKDQTWYTGNVLKEMDIYKDFDVLKRYAKKVFLYNNSGVFKLQSLGLFKRTITEIDIILPIVHGNGAEDGSLQGYLETIGIPYVGSNVIASAIGQDKVIMKQVFASADIPIVPYVWFFDTDFLTNQSEKCQQIEKIGYPVIVKPATLGSSIGITYVKDASKIVQAIETAISYDTKIIVEKAISNLTEANCSVLGNYEYQETSVIEEVTGSENILSYKDKYLGKGKKNGTSKGMVSTSRIIPAHFSPELKEEVESLSKKVFVALNLSGVCRIDFLIDNKSHKVYVNEPNTIPGSLSYYLWEKTNKKYEALLEEMITLGIRTYKAKDRKTHSFDSNILSNFNGTKGSKSK